MMHPFINMTIYGAIWYQGEANAGDDEQLIIIIMGFHHSLLRLSYRPVRLYISGYDQ